MNIELDQSGDVDLSLTGTGANVLDLAASGPVVLDLAGTGATVFDLDADTFELMLSGVSGDFGLSEAGWNLGLVYAPGFDVIVYIRVTEAGDTRITETGDRRIREVAA